MHVTAAVQSCNDWRDLVPSAQVGRVMRADARWRGTGALSPGSRELCMISSVIGCFLQGFRRSTILKRPSACGRSLGSAWVGVSVNNPPLVEFCPSSRETPRGQAASPHLLLHCCSTPCRLTSTLLNRQQPAEAQHRLLLHWLNVTGGAGEKPAHGSNQYHGRA